MGLSVGTLRWSSRSALLPTTINTTSFKFKFSSFYLEINTCESHPGFNIKVRLRICYIIYNDNTWGSFVVNFAQWFVSLLTSSVPNGDFDVLVTDLDNFGEELYSNSAFLCVIILISDVSGGDVGFASSLTANDNNFEHFVVFVHVKIWCKL